MRLTERSGETTMYSMKPVISLPKMTHTTDRIYEMKNIHGECGKGNHTGTGIKIVADVTEQNPLPEYALLEARQEKILAQLAELKKQVSSLCSFLKHTDHVKMPKECSEKESNVLSNQCEKSEPITVNLIINANPKKPPYSILALPKVWNDISIKLQSYVHSSVIGDIPELNICDKNPSKTNIINLSLIWKEVDELEFVTGLYNYSLLGEVNFLRYLCRLFPTHDFENNMGSIQANLFDTILDYCYCLQIEKSSKKQQIIFQHFTKTLGTNEWFGVNEPNIIDIAVWSVIKQISVQNIPSSLKKWINACDKTFK
ncbi:PREDICTED: aminoacyl tRNA synthase complex-interacting multifunctional protein 2 isoform X2 [Polistes dominula]|uniref:Aminoacyl tRNA synthase complex-interacting multifunctional protein 2 isoform X2 n=1 Tax=Polistes dominula TaxID=743375 RepID=A0ABM1I5N9_POLDO|nr:PREDICTED: aminoacyl tRNA synthase complex-interacting multifunctional protein 2 isoform X2 [Polistes dominula]